jgi:hypothetical protein
MNQLSALIETTISISYKTFKNISLIRPYLNPKLVGY